MTISAGRFFALFLVFLLPSATEEGREINPPHGPAGVFHLDWRTGQVGSTLAIGVFNHFGLRVDNDPSRARVVESDGSRIVEGIALAFDIRDDVAFDIDEPVALEIEVDVTNLDEFYVAWDRNARASSLSRIEIPDGVSGWHTFTVELDRARFANRGWGNVDLVVSSGIDMSTRVLRIRSLSIRLSGQTPGASPTGSLHLFVRDGSGDRPLAAQVGLFDSSGRMPLPGHMAVQFRTYGTFSRSVEVREELDHLSWPHENHWSMYVDGYYRAEIPQGVYQLVVVRGPEYPIVQRSFEVAAGAPVTVAVELDHILDMPSQGWYSGDVHHHQGRETAELNSTHMAHARATDLHMHWLYQLGNSVTTYFPQYAWGEAGWYQEDDYYLGSGQEDPRTDYLGHVLSMGQDRFVRDEGRYLLYDEVARAVHDAGGIFGVAHMDFAQFQQDIALSLLAARNQIDFVEVLQYHALHERDWYAFLNMGFRLPAAAGSDWPYMSLPGSVRTYVKVDGAFTPDAWNEGLKSGRSFVSNAPMLDMTVDGQGLGSVIETAQGQTLEVRARAYIEPSWDRLRVLELVVNGTVVDSVVAPGGRQELELRTEVEAEHGMWLAARVRGLKSRDIVFQSPYQLFNQAHTSPIYVEVDGEGSWDRVSGIQAAQHVIHRLEAFKDSPGGSNDNEAWDSPGRTAELVEIFRDRMNAWADETIAFYEARIAEIRAWSE
jgi:hypothetical protein